MTKRQRTMRFSIQFRSLSVWWERVRHRRRLRSELGQLDDALLHDAGLRRDDVIAEAGKPLWRS